MVKLGDGLRSSDYIHAARFLGDDGERIWFHAQQVMAYDHRTNEGRYTRARVVLDQVLGKPLRLTEPDGMLITHRLRPGLGATVGLVRLTATGEEVWKADTGLQDLHQILPDGKVMAFIGKQLPKYKDEVRGPGRVSSIPYW